jgi:protein phosphatase
MQIRVWCKTDKGLKRDNNQDSYLLSDTLNLYIVADGMGGHSGGEVASQMAVVKAQETIQSLLYKPGAKARDVIQKAYWEANKAIFHRANYESPELNGMGTTMVMALAFKNTLYIGNVGDSRAYLYRRPYLWQITEDHSLHNEQIRAGLDPSKSPVGRNVITRSVGFEAEVIADVLERPLQAGDCYLLCSDGLSSMVSDQQISEIINQHPHDQVVDQLLQAALRAGGHDNVTIMWIVIEDEGPVQ